MSSYTIAGSADMENTAIGEAIANEIKKFYKNIDFRIIIKHPKKWEKYIHEICRTYGFKREINPIIFTLDGKLIGGIEQFKEMAEFKFGIDLKDIQNIISTKINMRQVEKEVAAKKKIRKNKRTLQERIQDSLKQKYEDSILQPVKGIFISDINEGLQFYIKNEEKICPPVYVSPEIICEVHKQVILEETINLAQIAASDNYPPEVIEEEAEKSINQQSFRKPFLDSSSRDSKQFNSTLEQKSRELENRKSVQGETQREGSPVQLEESNNMSIQAPLSLNSHFQSAEGARASGEVPYASLKGLQEEMAELEHEEELEEDEEEQDYIQKKNISSIIKEFNYPSFVTIQPEVFDLSPFLIKSIKGTNYCLAFHPEPLFDGQMILFEKYPIQLEEEKVAEVERVDIQNQHLVEEHGVEGDQNLPIVIEKEPDREEEEEKSAEDLRKIKRNAELLRLVGASNIMDFSKTQRGHKIREGGKQYKKMYEEQQKLLAEKEINEKPAPIGGNEMENNQPSRNSQQQSSQQQNNQQNNLHQASIFSNNPNSASIQQNSVQLKELSQAKNEDILEAPISYNFKSRCSREDVDILKPLSKVDWKIVCKIMTKLSCIMTYQILPHGFHSHLPLSSGIINIFLRKFMISAHTNQSILSHLTEVPNDQDPQTILLPFEQTIIFDKPKARKQNGYYSIPTFEFKHAIHYFKENKKIKKKKIIKKYQKLIKCLSHDEQDLLMMGFNLILTRQFMLLVPLRKAYSYFNETPLFMHSLAYLGYIHQPKLIPKWPSTAFEANDYTTAMDKLKISVEC